MCVEWMNEWEVATEDITAYKVVRKHDGRFLSPTDKHDRADQGYGLGAGSILEYKIGKKMRAGEPGIYCTAYPMLLAKPGMVMLEVVIPKGTKFRRGKAGVPDESGQMFEMRTLNALAIKVVKVYKGKPDRRFLWPVAPSSAPQFTWTSAATTSTSFIVKYVVTSSTARPD